MDNNQSQQLYNNSTASNGGQGKRRQRGKMGKKIMAEIRKKQSIIIMITAAVLSLSLHRVISRVLCRAPRTVGDLI